jgi:response regulator RpfG family c-di-GMP phosphodiesterase
MNDNEKILLVDDEIRVVQALQRSLRTEFNIEIAGGPGNGLEVLAHQGPFAVVVSDLRMPVMDGIQFLARVKTASPDSIRVMLTGQADLNATIAAVNEGNIFRFLMKPCPPATLSRVLEAAIEQHRLVTAERELLQNTLMGCVTVLTEILSVVYPAAFSRSLRIKHYAALAAKALGMQNVWQFEAAAILSQIGCITLPLGTADKVYGGEELSKDENRLFVRHPLAAAAFLRRIPRLETTAQIIAWQQKPYREYETEPADVAGHLVALGAQMLHAAIDLERLVERGFDLHEAIAEMSDRKGEYNPELLQALEELGEPVFRWKPTIVSLADLDTSMVANDDIRARNGLLLLAKGEQVSYPVLERLRSFATEIGIVEPIQVLLPQEAHKQAELHATTAVQ